MIALDTNILARAIVDEQNPDRSTQLQQKKARDLLASGQTFFVPITVLQELEWVLRGVYAMQRDEVAAVLEDMCAVETLVLDRAAAVEQALESYRYGLDFSDALHFAQSGLCGEFVTFDRRFSKAAQRLGLQPEVNSL